jgi:signal peptidase I
MLKEKLKKVISVFQWLLTILLVLVVLLLVFTAFNPVKSFQVLRVMSGSMEPAIKVGSVVFTQKVKPETLKTGEIITYTSVEDPKISVTHRLVAIEEKEGKSVFKTKGDANNTEDNAGVSPSQIKGKVIFSLPFLGYLSVWIKKPLGFGLLVILPAILIIISEILNIKRVIEKEVEKKYKSINSLLIFFLLGISLFQVKPINAYFSDTAVIEGNTFSMASEWPPPPPPVAGSVVINEVMWMGSTVSSADEWIELRNMTNLFVDVGKWTVENAKDSGTRTVRLPNGVNSIIPANGYLLIAKYPETSANSALNVSVDIVENLSLLDSENGDLILKDNEGNIIDQAEGDIWPAGSLYKSMERNNDPTTGWHTCLDIACNDTTYWKVEGNNYGTPKNQNLSENDSISLDPSPTLSLTSTVKPESTPNPSPTLSQTPE